MIERRTLLKAGITAGLGLGLTPNLAMGQDGPKPGDFLVKVDDPMKQPLSPGEIKRGAKPILAWAMDPMNETLRNGSPLNQVLLVRLDPNTLAADTRSRATDGVLAHSPLAIRTAGDDWLADEQVLHCACHGSKFDPKDSAKVVAGEAPRPLAALPLKLDDGQLVVAGPFTARVGF
jgi:nitrite reductase/ring-hydroxylating ferredoxin subunit